MEKTWRRHREDRRQREDIEKTWRRHGEDIGET